MTGLHGRIRGIVFDLDGTLYDSAEFAAAIQDSAAGYIAALKHLAPAEARRMITEERARLTEESGTVPTLSAVCRHLGGTVQDLHAHFAASLQPESYLERDERVIHLLAKLGRAMPLFLLTNNNRTLTDRIVAHLGLGGFFRRIYTIDGNWQAKPDPALLEQIFAESDLQPAQTLFVGDRYDVDLRLPEQMGCPVYLSQTVEQLLRLEEILLR